MTKRTASRSLTPATATVAAGVDIEGQALERILLAAGAKNVPADLDRSALWNDIRECMELHSLVPALSSLGRTKDEIGRLQKIKKLTTELARLLSDDETWGLLASSWHRHGFDREFGDQRRVVESLRDAVKSTPLARSSPHEESRFFKGLFGGGSSFEQLVDKNLPKVFKDHFHIDAASSRKADGTPGAPYLHFALRVLKEFNITNGDKPYKAESIIRARSGQRTGRIRQKATRRLVGKMD
jgi:hypothetical protein